RDGIERLDAGPDQGGGQPVASLPRLRPSLAQLTVDDGDPVRVHVRRAVEEMERGEGKVVRLALVKSLRIGCCTHYAVSCLSLFFAICRCLSLIISVVKCRKATNWFALGHERVFDPVRVGIAEAHPANEHLVVGNAKMGPN